MNLRLIFSFQWIKNLGLVFTICASGVTVFAGLQNTFKIRGINSYPYYQNGKRVISREIVGSINKHSFTLYPDTIYEEKGELWAGGNVEYVNGCYYFLNLYLKKVGNAYLVKFNVPIDLIDIVEHTRRNQSGNSRTYFGSANARTSNAFVSGSSSSAAYSQSQEYFRLKDRCPTFNETGTFSYMETNFLE